MDCPRTFMDTYIHTYMQACIYSYPASRRQINSRFWFSDPRVSYGRHLGILGKSKLNS